MGLFLAKFWTPWGGGCIRSAEARGEARAPEVLAAFYQSVAQEGALACESRVCQPNSPCGICGAGLGGRGQGHVQELPRVEVGEEVGASGKLAE